MLSLDVPVTHTKESCWMVPSQTDGSIEYTIRLINKTCYCKLSCTHCHACVLGTCVDATLHATVCKHVHLVQMTTMSTACKDSSTPVNCITLQYFSENTNSTYSELPALRLQVQHQINELNTLVQKCQHVRRCTKSLYTTLIICHNSDQGHRKELQLKVTHSTSEAMFSTQ